MPTASQTITPAAASPKPEAQAQHPKPATTGATPRAKAKGGESTWAARIGSVLFTLCTIGIIAVGWLGREQSGLTAESGTGYALGIVGAVTMLMLLLYPARKRLAFMRRWGSVPVWFSTHMIMGIIAPVCILFHANFQLGSLNSNVALISTLTVAGSGVIGRFIYTKVHYGLYGGRVTLNALREDALTAKGQLSAEFAFAPQLRARLQAFEEAVLAPSRNPLHSLLKLVVLGNRVRVARFQMSRFMAGALKLRARQAGWGWSERRRHRRDARRFLKAYLRTVRKVAELGFYERLFSFWHVLHLPLFFMLVVAGVLHVVAVHMY